MAMFYIFTKKPSNLTVYKRSILLIKDNWDDWFTYETQFFMYYVNSEGKLLDIGMVKIGQEEMEKGQRSPNLPDQFNALPNDCFSLGQSDYYYERINHLGDSIRINILSNMRDLAFDQSLYLKVKSIEVTRTSLMRDVTHFMLTHQYRRIAQGNARLTKYRIEYTYPLIDENDDEVKLSFEVEPDSNPPTNIHVVIGRNNVGKTYLIKNMILAMYSIDDGENHGILRSTSSDTGRLRNAKTQAFANVLCVSFSPFDNYSDIVSHLAKKKAMPFRYIGIKQNVENTDSINEDKKAFKDEELTMTLSDMLVNDFIQSLENCMHSRRKLDMLNMALSILESDPIFERSDLRSLINREKKLPRKVLISNANYIFKKLSSGHQVIMLTLTQLIEYLTERTFVVLDEPENHLHPPLLAAFIRAISELLIRYNGVALVATHSPVILQEVPKKCAWKINSGFCFFAFYPFRATAF